MTDLISRADAIEAVKETILKRFNLADWYEEMLNCGVEIEDRIKALPSADAREFYKSAETEEKLKSADAVSRINYTPKPCENANCDCVAVVRCKDCKKRGAFGEKGFCELYARGVPDEHYCSYGERREP